MNTSVLNRLIDDFKNLPSDDKEYAVELITKQLIEAKRDSIYRRSEQVTRNMHKGMTKTGTIKELRKDLDGD